jgi:Cytochrome c-type biogenesis protein CcmE
MIRKNRLNKIFIIVSLLISLTLILYSILRALETNIDLYLTPTQVESGEYKIDKSFKLGGMVKKES